MDVTLRPSRVRGRAEAPPSKSYTHRAILAAGYAADVEVHNALRSADTRATMRAVEAFGGSIDRAHRTLHVEGFAGRPSVPADVIDCANSGTTTRLVTACGALAPGLTVLTGDGSLRSRPQGPLLDAIDQLDGRAESTRHNGQAPLIVGGSIDGGTVTIPGDVSSQYVTALLMAGAVTPAGIEIELETPLKSAPYVDVTRDVLGDFDVETTETASGFAVSGGQSYAAPDGYVVPGDFSSMSYLLALGALAAEDAIVVDGARPSAQGDAAILDTLEAMGAALSWDRDAGTIEIERSSLSGVTVDVGDTPDLLPTYAVLGAAAEGRTTIENCEHVRYKETDRVSAMAEALDRMGAHVEEEPDRLTVRGSDSRLTGATLDGRGDHRIVMALAVAGLVADGETTITGAEHVDVSFPGFFDVLTALGARIDRAE